ncbi:MAG TPA: MFS transporter [Tepidisphaeraceae bacterium]|nr:MFS transporter [Tepidisphaeraceae bacterium]
MADQRSESGRPGVSPTIPRRLFSVEALASAGTNLLVTAIYFYTTSRFHWGLKQNFLLATGQGFFYIGGALSAHKIAETLKPRRALSAVYIFMATLALSALAVRTATALTLILLVYNFAGSVSWPIIESLVSSGVDAHKLSRRIAAYNLVWSFVSLVMVAVDGSLIEHWPAGVFLIPAAAHAISSALMLKQYRGPALVAADPGDSRGHFAGDRDTPGDEGPEPELLRVRTLALWLSRVALPATYVVIFSLMALMPSLPVMKRLDPASQTLLGSAWMLSRWVTFLILGMGTWWHTRPRLLLLAAVVMLFAFFGVTLRPSDIFANAAPALDIPSMIVAQFALGAALGVIYSGSLYFGMALSQGSTEHGGYHEALIGMGFVLGPGVGAIAQVIRPGNVYTGIAAVGTVVFFSVLAVAVTSIIGGRMENQTIIGG